MLIVRDVELKKTFTGRDFRNLKFQTVVDVKIGEGYGSSAKITLTDEQTARAIEFILGLVREGLSVNLEVREPVEELPAPVEPIAHEYTMASPVPADAPIDIYDVVSHANGFTPL